MRTAPLSRGIASLGSVFLQGVERGGSFNSVAVMNSLVGRIAASAPRARRSTLEGAKTLRRSLPPLHIGCRRFSFGFPSTDVPASCYPRGRWGETGVQVVSACRNSALVAFSILSRAPACGAHYCASSVFL